MIRLLNELITLLKNKTRVVTVTIPNGGTESDPIDTNEHSLVAIYLTAAITGATISLEGRVEDGDDYETIVDTDGSAYTIDSTNGNAIPVDSKVTIGFKAVRLVSAGAEGAERTIKVALRRIG